MDIENMYIMYFMIFWSSSLLIFFDFDWNCIVNKFGVRVFIVWWIVICELSSYIGCFVKFNVGIVKLWGFLIEVKYRIILWIDSMFRDFLDGEWEGGRFVS